MSMHEYAMKSYYHYKKRKKESPRQEFFLFFRSYIFFHLSVFNTAYVIGI